MLLAACGDVPSGSFCGPMYVMRGAPVLEATKGYSHDLQQAADLWKFSCEACGITDFGNGALVSS